MRKPNFTMTQEDLDKYDHDGTGDEGLKWALRNGGRVDPSEVYRDDKGRLHLLQEEKSEQSQTDQPNPFAGR